MIIGDTFRLRRMGKVSPMILQAKLENPELSVNL